MRTSLTAVALLLTACDTSVTNPGLTPDGTLDKPEAWPAIVVGARRALADAIGSASATGGQLLYWSAAVTFEINPAGSTGSFGIPTDVQAGILNDATSSADWASSNQARFVPEDAVRRFKRVMPDTLFGKSLLVGQAYLYAGFANRTLGESFCQSVIPLQNPDGSLSPGSLGSHTLYFLRADTAFTNALAVFTASGKTDTQTTNFIRAARAGRAWDPGPMPRRTRRSSRTRASSCYHTLRRPRTSTITSTGRGRTSRSARTQSGGRSTKAIIARRRMRERNGTAPG